MGYAIFFCFCNLANEMLGVKMQGWGGCENEVWLGCKKRVKWLMGLSLVNVWALFEFIAMYSTFKASITIYTPTVIFFKPLTSMSPRVLYPRPMH